MTTDRARASAKNPAQTGARAEGVMAAKKRVKAGSNRAAANSRKKLFATAMIATSGNKRASAVMAGFKPGRAADKAGERLSHDVAVQAMIAEAAEKAANIAGLELNRTLREVARLAYFDPAKLYGEDGRLKDVQDMDEDARAGVASIEVEEIFERDDPEEELEPQPQGGALKRKRGNGMIIGRTKKLKMHDKNSALEKAMKYHGLYAKDNSQRGDPAVAALLQAVGLDAAHFTVKR